MTHVTTTVLARIQSNISSLYPPDMSIPTPSKRADAHPLANCPSDILRHVHSQLTKKLYGENQFNNTYGLWRTLLSAIRDGKLSLDLLSDKPSDLANGLLWLNHDRVTGLLEEQNLRYSDIPPVLFHIIMSSTTHLYPDALIDKRYIASEHSMALTNEGIWQPEHRYCFCIRLDCLPTLPINYTATASV